MPTTDPPPVMSDEDFVAAMSPFSEALSRWAVAWADQPRRRGFLASAESKAMAELDAEKRWATAEWQEPVRNAHTYGDLLCRVLAEHLAALATIIVQTPVGPAYAHLPSVRAMFEAVPTAHWLLDPAIDVETRIQRSITHRLKSANEVRRIKYLPSAVEDGERARQRCKEYAWHHGWKIQPIGRTGEEIVQGAPRPRPQDVFSEIAFGEANPDRDAAVWAVICAGHHSTQYMLTAPFRHGITVPDPIDPRGGLAPVVVDGVLLADMALMCWTGCSAVAAARDRLMGWSSDPEMQQSAADVERHARAFRPPPERRVR